MHLRHTAVAAILLVGLAQTATAQSAPAPTGTSGRRGNDGAVAMVDVSRLPIDVGRIQRELRQTTIREEREGLNLRYFVEVFATAPEIVLFTPEDNLLTGPVPYGAPTHREMLDMMTPQEHRAPAADLGSLFRWLSGKNGKK